MKKVVSEFMVVVRRLVYGFLYFSDVFFGREDLKVIIFCYHAIGADTWRFSIDKNIFKQQINYLLENRKAISVEDLQAYLEGDGEIKEPSFLLCFDDGYRDILQVQDFLQAKKIKPLLFVLAQHEKADHAELGTDREFLKDEEIKSLERAGWIIGSHGSTHQDFGQLREEARILEIADSRKLLQESLGFPIDHFAYPRGRYDQKIVEQVREAGYRMAFSMDDSIINKMTNRYIIPRIGVDSTHSFAEFKFIYSHSVVRLRELIKRSFFS